MEGVHDHCRSCYAKYCDFDIVQDVSCRMIFCENDCGHKFHRCKQDDHAELCSRNVMDCVNRRYGCPMSFLRERLQKHLEVCPANVLICTMEWNRWHHGSLISKTKRKETMKNMQIKKMVDKHLDIACAVHDQRILLETIMPRTVLQYYSDLADGKTGSYAEDVHRNHSVAVKESPDQAIIVEDLPSSNFDAVNGKDPVRESSEDSGVATPQVQTTIENLLKYMDGIQANKGRGVSKTSESMKDAKQKLLKNRQHNTATESTSFHTSDVPDSTASHSSAERIQNGEEKVQSTSTIMSNFKEIDAYIKEFSTAAPGFMSLLNALDSDACVVVDTVDMIVNKVVKEIDGENTGGDNQLLNAGDNEHHEFPTLDWKEDDIASQSEIESKGDELKGSINKLLHEIGVVCSHTIGRILGETSSDNARDSRNARRSERRKKRSWLFSTNVTTGGHVSASWGWMPRKELKDASTDTSDLPVDLSSLEWLSPEFTVSKDDLMFRLFSIIGASNKGGSPIQEKQVNHFVMESSCQTVAPFLLHINFNSIGRALCSASLSSSTKNPEERRQMLSLLTNGKKDVDDDITEPVKISDNLAYDNLALGDVIESVPRYQTKPSSMYSFMCGCIVRRDQFSAHVQNIHCEIMSGLNGWIEQKCPYSAYGCNYSEPRFCPDHRDNAVIYSQEESSFTISPGHWSQNSKEVPESICNTSLLDLPYEVHERIFKFLDCFAIRQLSVTSSYLREVCKNHLSSRGVVEVKWVKRSYPIGNASWQMEKKIWSFPTTSAKINKWVLSDSPAMVQHVARCPVIAECDTKYKEEKIKVLPVK